jgi:hypothetical protein
LGIAGLAAVTAIDTSVAAVVVVPEPEPEPAPELDPELESEPELEPEPPPQPATERQTASTASNVLIPEVPRDSNPVGVICAQYPGADTASQHS